MLTNSTPLILLLFFSNQTHFRMIFSPPNLFFLFFFYHFVSHQYFSPPLFFSTFLFYLVRYLLNQQPQIHVPDKLIWTWSPLGGTYRTFTFIFENNLFSYHQEKWKSQIYEKKLPEFLILSFYSYFLLFIYFAHLLFFFG